MAIQKIQEYKSILDKSHESRRNLLKPDFLTSLSNAEKIVTEMKSIIQQAMTDALNYIDSCNTAANDPLENTAIPEVSGLESSELSRNDENRSQAKQIANETVG